MNIRFTLSGDQLFFAAFPIVFTTLMVLSVGFSIWATSIVIFFIAYAQWTGYMEGMKAK